MVVQTTTFCSSVTKDVFILKAWITVSENTAVIFGISEKATHKIRKTYISTLIDNGLNINEIRKIAGHENEQITYDNYCFNRMTNEQTENLFEAALN